MVAFVNTTEVREMLRRLNAGDSRGNVARVMGRPASTILRHTKSAYPPGMSDALRVERLLQACNRALEAR